MTSDDHRTDAEAYRLLMFDLAGPGDPSGAMARAPGEVRTIVTSAGEHLRTRPAAGEWSVIELVGHMLDAELVVGNRLRRVLYETDVTLPGFDQDVWVQAGAYNDADPEPLLAALASLRPITIAVWQRSTPEQRAQVGLHAERGHESAETIYRMLAGHDRFHLEQMRATLESVRSR